MTTKRNVVLYLDKDLVEKSKELGLNLSKTLENHLKHLIIQLSICNSLKNFNSPENKNEMDTYFQNCKACICFYCGADVLKEIEANKLRCPRCGAELQ